MKLSAVCTILLAALLLRVSEAQAAPGPEAVCARATTIFCTGFEEGNFGLWNDWDGNPSSTNQLVADAGPLNLADNHIARFVGPAARGVTDLVKVLPATYDKVYVRWYQRWASNYNFNVESHGGGVHAGDRGLLGHADFRPTGADWFSAWVEPVGGRLTLYTYYRGMYQDCADPNGSCWGDHFPCFLDEGSYCEKAEHREHTMPPMLQTNRWYCIELMMDAGTPVTSDAAADGSMNLWIDNVEYGPFNHLWFRTTANLKIGISNLATFAVSQTTGLGDTFYDNYVVSRERIGCGNTKAPNPATDVRAN